MKIQPIPTTTDRHHSASRVMPISDPRDRFFYPHHTPMKDTYNKGLHITISCRYLKVEVHPQILISKNKLSDSKNDLIGVEM